MPPKLNSPADVDASEHSVALHTFASSFEEDGGADSFLRAIVNAPPAEHPSLLIGTTVGASGRYRVERLLGRGGMGTVYAAHDCELQRTVALKLLDAAQATQDQGSILREARIAAGLEHERVARIYDVGVHQGTRFVAMELIRGRTLRAVLNAGASSASEVVSLALQIAEGLAALHSAGVVHRDLKPENVMIGQRGELKLLDFGLARQAVDAAAEHAEDASLTREDGRSVGGLGGTPGYMAPEQYSGVGADPRADVFAFGVLIFELVVGTRPFFGATFQAVARATCQGGTALVQPHWRNVPRVLRDVVARCLQSERAARFADGNELLAGLAALRTPTLTPSAGAILRRVRRGALLALVLGGVGIAVFRAVRSEEAQRPAPAGMTWIPGATLRVGRSLAEIDAFCREQSGLCDRTKLQREVPEAEVRVARFALDTREVTNRELATMLNSVTPSLSVLPDADKLYPRFVRWRDGIGRSNEVLVDLSPEYGRLEYTRDQTFRVVPGREDEPVVQVSWYGAEEYCRSIGKLLPSEDQWESAARGVSDRTFPWGERLPSCGEVALPSSMTVAANSVCPELKGPWMVGRARADVTPEGVFDLGGNVAEWTATAYVAGSRGRQPGPADRSARVVKGGSWATAVNARTSGRALHLPGETGANVGFRCAVPY